MLSNIPVEKVTDQVFSFCEKKLLAVPSNLSHRLKSLTNIDLHNCSVCSTVLQLSFDKKQKVTAIHLGTIKIGYSVQIMTKQNSMP